MPKIQIRQVSVEEMTMFRRGSSIDFPSYLMYNSARSALAELLPGR
jgi:hypothetical protein